MPTDVGTVLAGDDVLPIMATDGTTGVNNSKQIRRGFIGALLGPGSAELITRDGVLAKQYGTGAEGPKHVSMSLLQNASPAQNVVPYQGVAVISRSGQGPYLYVQRSSPAIPLGLADATNPRYDLVYLRLYDDALGDAQHGVKWSVVTGDPAAVPVIPSLPAVDGVIAIGAVRRPAGVNTVANSQITDLRKGAMLFGGTRILLPGDDPTTDAGYIPGEERRNRTTGRTESWDGSAWMPYSLGAGVIARFSRTTNTTGSTSVTFVADMRMDGVALKAGRLYRIATNNIQVDGNAGDNIRAIIFFSTAGNAGTGSAVLPGAQANVDATAGSGSGGTVQIETHLVPASDATYSFLLAHARIAGGGSAILVGNSDLPIQITVTDLGPAPASSGTNL